MFQLHDAAAQCGLFDIERGCRAREALRVGGHHRIPQLANFYTQVLPRLPSLAVISRGRLDNEQTTSTTESSPETGWLGTDLD